MLAAINRIPPATTAANTTLLDATASAVNFLTSVPQQLTPEAQTSALDVLATVVSGAGPSVSQGTAETIVGVLDSLASAAALQQPLAAAGNSTSSGSAAAAAAVLQAVVDVSTSLSANLLAGLVAAAAPAAVSVSTPSIQLTVQVAAPAVLRSANVSAPGSPSWFDPLPAAAFGAAPAGAPASLQFASFAFNPYYLVSTATLQPPQSGGRRRLLGSLVRTTDANPRYPGMVGAAAERLTGGFAVRGACPGPPCPSCPKIGPAIRRCRPHNRPRFHHHIIPIVGDGIVKH